MAKFELQFWMVPTDGDNQLLAVEYAYGRPVADVLAHQGAAALATSLMAAGELADECQVVAAVTRLGSRGKDAFLARTRRIRTSVFADSDGRLVGLPRRRPRPERSGASSVAEPLACDVPWSGDEDDDDHRSN